MNEGEYLLALRSWWSRKYSRPIKDPVLQSYTFEELLYEFYDHKEREAARNESTKANDDKIEEDRLQESLDWAEQEELRELEEFKRQQAAKAEDKTDEEAKFNEDGVYKPNEEEQKWMEEQMKKQAEEQLKKGKQIYGDDFGEDIEGSFDDGE